MDGHRLSTAVAPMIGRIVPVMWLEQLGAAMNTKAGSPRCAARFIGVSLPNTLTFFAGLSAGSSGEVEQTWQLVRLLRVGVGSRERATCGAS